MADTEAQQQPVEETTTATQQEETPAPVATENAETAPEEPKQSNEPVEGGSLADAALVPVSSTIYTAISFLSLLLLIIGTALPWLRSDFNGSKSTVSLWKEERETAGVVTTVFVVDQTCKELREYYRASESFAIISIVTAALALLAGLASRFAGKALKPFGTILSALTFVAALIAWAIAANGLFRTFCNSQSYRDQHYYVYTGTGTFIAGWVLSFVGLIVSVSDISVPKIVPEALVDKFVATLFTLFALVAFGFSVIATPISFTSKWNTGSTETRVTIWHQYTYASNGDETNKFALKNSNCGDLSRYAKFAEAFSILSIAFTLIALIVGALSTRAANYKALLATGFLAGLTTTVTLSAELALYYKKFCTAQDSLNGQGFRLDAGLALFATAAVLTVFAFLFTLVVAISRAVGSKQSEGGNPRTTLLYIFGTAISVLFMIIALTMPVFQQETSDTAYTKVYYWETANLAAGVFTKQDFTCEPIWGRLVGAGALGIIAIVLSGLGVLLAIGQLSSASLRVPASAITLLASVLQLTAFALVMAVFQGSYCNFKPYATQYKYAVGFGLMVAAFCVNFLVSLVNLLIA